MQAKFNAYLFLTFISILALTFYAGGRPPGSIELFEVALLVPSLFFINTQNSQLKKTKVILPLFMGYLLLLLITIIQILPLPSLLIEMIAPVSAQAYREVGAIQKYISLSTENTMSSLMWIFSLGVFSYILLAMPKYLSKKTFWLQTSSHLIQDHVSVVLEYTIIFCGTLSAFVGLFHYLFNIEHFFSQESFDSVYRVNPRTHFPFTNPNHLSFMIEISLPFISLKFVTAILDYYNKTANPLVLLKRRQAVLFWLLILLVLILALFTTMSKAGIFFGLLSMLFFFYQIKKNYKFNFFQEEVLKNPKYRYYRSAFFVLISILAIVLLSSLGLFVLGESGQEALSSRFERVANEGVDAGRIMFAKISLQALPSFLLFGGGMGCWHLAVSPLKTKEVAMWKLDYAHNEFLQLFLEAGIFGFLSFFFTCSYIVYLLYKELKKEDLGEEDCLRTIAYLASFIFPLLHALLDFPFHIPALLVNFLLVVILIFRARLN